MPNFTTNYNIPMSLFDDTADIEAVTGVFETIDGILAPTVNQALAPSSATQKGLLATVLGWLANRIRAITGKTNWYDNPAVTLEQCSTHINDTLHTAATSTKNGINLWVVADNLRKGAALNAIEILEKLMQKT